MPHDELQAPPGIEALQPWQRELLEWLLAARVSGKDLAITFPRRSGLATVRRMAAQLKKLQTGGAKP